jgi:arylformamidase
MKKATTIIDISLPIFAKMIVYPKNAPVQIKPMKTASSYLSQVSFSSHTGTHVDAPRHILKTGSGVDKISLKQIIGQCRVLDLTAVKKSIKTEDLKKYQIKKGERILVKTKNSQQGFKKFYKNYIYLDGEAADYLALKKISLFGIDYLSVKQFGSPDIRPHTSLLKRNIVIFEGLDLSKVKAGKYFFIGLPLKFKDLDGAPARAVLIK